MVNLIMNLKLKTIRTLYHKVYEVEDNFQHVGGDWWLKRRLVELYENFYAKLGFIKRAPVGVLSTEAEGRGG